MIPAVIVVNYATPDLTVECLRSLSNEICPSRGDRVIVVDGGSYDDSVVRIRQAIDEHDWSWVSLIELDENRGFAFGNNSAIQHAMTSNQPPNCFWLLNPDTIVQPGALQTLLTFLDDHPRAGIVGGGVEDPNGAPEHASFRFPSLWSELDLHLRLRPVSWLLRRRIVAPPIRSDNHRTDWVNGANLMVRRSVFDEVGFLDEAFFLYYEETDLCLRATAAEWEVWNVPAGRVTHFGGASTGILHNHSEVKRRPDYWFDSRRRFFRKHYGYVYSALTDAVSVVSLATWNVRRLIQRKPRRDPPSYLFDLFRHSAFVPRLSR